MDNLLRSVLVTGGVVLLVIAGIILVRRRTAEKFVDIMTYRDAIGYLAENQSLDPRIAKGAMYRSPHPQGYLFTQVFLDSANNPISKPNGNVYGRKLVVGQFDRELLEIFGEKDVIIVE
jgi:hypothetical protein